MSQIKDQSKPWKYDGDGNREEFKFTFPNLEWLKEVGEEFEFLEDERGFLGQLLKHLAAEALQLKKQLRRAMRKNDNNKLWVHKYQELYAKERTKQKHHKRVYNEVMRQFEILHTRIEEDVRSRNELSSKS